jgi:UDP-N-acetylmuramoyl-tripeptide--D-alanyl-D-alanine ligase
LSDVIKALTNIDIAPLDTQLSGAVIDSREAVDSSLFIALPGEHTDGHQFVSAAFDNGAVAALVEKEIDGDFYTLDLRKHGFDPNEHQISLPICLLVDNTLNALQDIAAFWRKSHPVRTIGITGSVGKTSTKELTASLLSQKFNVLKNPGNLNNEIGLPLTLLKLDDHHEVAVLEMGFYVPGEIRTLCDIALPHIGVITNIGTVHAERAGSQEVIARGKSELVQALPSAPEGTAILNMDDPRVRQMVSQTKARVFSYGIFEPADLTADDIEIHGLQGLSCTLNYKGVSHQVHSPLLGEFSVYTILAAMSVALAEGLDWDTIEQGLSASQIDLRMQHYALANSALVLDDTYNASPASTIAALKLLSGLEGRRVAILGDMLELGQYEISGHKAVGEFSSQAADLLILVGHRSKIIRDSAIESGFPEDKIHWFENSDQAAPAAVDIVQKGDVVLIKGSNSMRMGRIIEQLKERV